MKENWNVNFVFKNHRQLDEGFLLNLYHLYSVKALGVNIKML